MTVCYKTERDHHKPEEENCGLARNWDSSSTNFLCKSLYLCYISIQYTALWYAGI